ncbi:MULTISPECIES: FixH family protein [unclassified Sinorhizobium]|uniref:FixH family protein n=1 Tax=unclassified Sinorhizobium TaxID=2613772 RepID=UPI0024C3BCA3|nr:MULTISPECIES: FixH family protein [unclassified Sinorhizobium]MDK1376802.1 FixH family protein [Sinorhizobium sp. 6-70]MDK1479574.1 FixH family protein [Sinorhizobium sp. 6-117]
MIPRTFVSGRKDLWIPGCFIFFFILLAGFEVWFVALANRSFTGVVTDNAYAIGLNYNEVLAQREAEKRLGWKTTLSFDEGEKLGGRLTLRVHDADGQLLIADEVRATAERMSRFPQIQAVQYDRQPNGDYVADLSVPLAGRWFIRARIARGGQTVHIIEEVDVRP